MKGVIGCLAYWLKKERNRIRVDHGEIVDTRNERKIVKTYRNGEYKKYYKSALENS